MLGVYASFCGKKEHGTHSVLQAEKKRLLISDFVRHGSGRHVDPSNHLPSRRLRG